MRTFATVILGSVILSGCAGQYAYPDLYSPVIRTPVTGTASTGNDKSAIGLSSPTEICSYPSSAITRNQANTVNSPLKGVLDRAAELQCGYAKGYKAAAQAQDFGRLPIVALAGLASLVILNDKMDAAKDAGKLGILAGVYSQSRNSLSAEDLSLSYIKGHGALTCVMAQGYRFEGKGAEIRFDAYNVLVAQHAQAMRSLTSLTTINPVP